LGDFWGEVRKLINLGSYAQPQGHYQRKGPAIQGSKDLLFEFHRAYTVQSKPSDDFVYIYQPPFNQNSVTAIHPPKQTWNLITSWKRRKIYKQPILGFHVHFWGVCKNKNPTTIAGARLLHMRETTPMTSTAFVSGDCYLLRESTGLETKATAVSGNTVGLVGCYGP